MNHGYGEKFHDPSQGSSAPFLVFPVPQPPPPYPLDNNGYSPDIRPASGPGQADSVTPRASRSRRVLLFDAGKDERSIFLRKVHAVLLGMSIVICGTIALVLYLPEDWQYFEFKEMSGWEFWPIWVTCLLAASVVTAFEKIMRKPPMNFVLLTIITISFGLLLGTFSAFIETIKILIEVGIVGVVCLCVVVFTFQRKYEYTRARSFFYDSAVLVIAFGFLCTWYCPVAALKIMIAPTVFMIYTVVATQFMIKDEELDIQSSEYVYAAVSVCMFFVSIISKIIRMCPCWNRCVSK